MNQQTQAFEHREAAATHQADTEQLSHAREKVNQLTSLAQQLDMQRQQREGSHKAELSQIMSQTNQLQQLLETERQSLTAKHTGDMHALEQEQKVLFSIHRAQQERELIRAYQHTIHMLCTVASHWTEHACSPTCFCCLPLCMAT